MGSLVASALRTGMKAFGVAVPPRLSILIFHRVHAAPDPLFSDEPDAARFERLIRLIARCFRVMTLADAALCLDRGELPSQAMVITFDDGYADNAEVALPILSRYGLPATFFVATDSLDGGRMWNDSVIECLRVSRRSEIDLDAFGLGRVALSGPGARRTAIDTLLPRLKYLSLVERENAIDLLCRVCDVRKLPANLMMRSEQVMELHLAGMEIGGHTVHHPILTRLSVTEAEREIAQGRARLQEIIDAPVDVFAYPNGKPRQDYESCHVDIVRRLGFKAAVSTVPGVALAGADLLQLPRFTPWDRTLPKWALRLLLNQRNTDFDQAVAPPVS